MAENNGFEFDDVFSDIFNSVYGDSQDENGADFLNARPAVPREEAAEPELPAQEMPAGEEQEDEYDDDRFPEDEAEETEEAEESTESEETEFDPRFRIGRRADGTHREFSYAGHRVSSSQELDYDANQKENYDELRSSYGENEEYELDKQFGLIPEDEEPNVKSKLKHLFKKEKQEKPAAEQDPDDRETDDAEELQSPTGKRRGKKNLLRRFVKPNPDEEDELSAYDEDYAGAYEKEDELLPNSTFKDYAVSKLAAVLLKIRGGVPADGMTGSASADEEFLGEEVTPLIASKYYGANVHSLRLRTRISLILSVISIYLSLGGPVPGMLSSLRVASAACLAIEFTVMLLALDVVTNAITNCFRKKFCADTLAVLSCVIAAFDALTVINIGGVMTHMPFCSVATLTLTGMLLSSLLSSRGLRKALRVPAIGKNKYAVTTELNVTGKEITILKSNRSLTGFVRRMEEAPVDEIIYSKISVFIAAFALILAILASLIKKTPSRILYIYSAILCACVPFSALLCFSFPFFMGTLKIFGNGASIAGWSGVSDLGHSKNLIVTDNDVFPGECVEIENVRIFADYDADKVIQYAGSLIRASGCGLAPAFTALMDENECREVPIDNLEFLAGGGIKGMAEGNVIIVGGTDLMRLLNIRVPFRLVSQTSVLLSINGILYGIFNVKYKADPKIRKALVSLMRSSRHPMFAIRDFNVTPEMLRELFDVATDGYDFPPYSERFRLSDAKPSEDSQISAVVCREGLGPLTDLADTARRIYLVSIICTAISVAGSLIGAMTAFISVLSTGTVSLTTLFVVFLIFNLPVLLLGFLTNTFE